MCLVCFRTSLLRVGAQIDRCPPPSCRKSISESTLLNNTSVFHNSQLHEETDEIHLFPQERNSEHIREQNVGVPVPQSRREK